MRLTFSINIPICVDRMHLAAYLFSSGNLMEITVKQPSTLDNYHLD